MSKKNKIKKIYQEISNPEEQIIDMLENGEDVPLDRERILALYKKISTPEERIVDLLENLHLLKGKDGRTPKKGEDYFTKQEIKDFLIQVTPKKNKDYFDGKSVSKEELVEIIKSLIPDPVPGKDGDTITAKQIRDKITSLEGKERLSVLSLKDLEWLKEKMQWTSAGGLFPSNLIYSEIPAGNINGSNMIFTLSNTPIAGTLALYYNGQRLQLTTDYTLSGKIITMILAPLTGSTIMADYQK